MNTLFFLVTRPPNLSIMYSVESIYGPDTIGSINLIFVSCSAFEHEINKDETNWEDIDPDISVVPPRIPPPLTRIGGVPSLSID